MAKAVPGRAAAGVRILKAKRSQHHHAALRLFARTKRCYEAAGLSAQWERLVNEVRAQHSRKRGFLPGFELIVKGSWLSPERTWAPGSGAPCQGPGPQPTLRVGTSRACNEGAHVARPSVAPEFRIGRQAPAAERRIGVRWAPCVATAANGVSFAACNARGVQRTQAAAVELRQRTVTEMTPDARMPWKGTPDLLANAR